MDNIELFLSSLPKADIRIKDVFAPGLYIRKMWAPAGSVLTSKIHRTEHPFIVSKGRILVWDGIHRAVILKASYDGITLPGTRRLGVALEDTIWMNVHATDITPVDDSEGAKAAAVLEIEKMIIEPYENLLLNQ